jgi:hypothetical protein
MSPSRRFQKGMPCCRPGTARLRLTSKKPGNDAAVAYADIDTHAPRDRNGGTCHSGAGRGTGSGGSVNLHAAPGGVAVIQTGDGTFIIKNIQGIDPEVSGALSKQYGVTESALKSFFKILEQKDVPLEDLDSKLREIAASYKQLQAQLQRLLPEDPAVMGLKRDASNALEAADFARVEQLLNQASETVLKRPNNSRGPPQNHRCRPRLPRPTLAH